MDSEIKVKWLEALRSGKYVQGLGKLRNYKEQYCCLGVLCDVVDSAAWSRCNPHALHYEYDKFYGGGTSPRIKMLTGILPDDEMKLLNMNDVDKLSFNEIADWIERYL